MPGFNKAKAWQIGKHFSDLSWGDCMFPQKFLNNIFKPNEASNLQYVLS